MRQAIKTLSTIATCAALLACGTAAAEDLTGPYIGISVEPITYSDGPETDEFYFEFIDVQAGFSKVLANDVYIAGEGVYNINAPSGISEAYGANAKIGRAIRSNLAIYGIAGVFAVEADDGSDDDGFSYGAGITYAMTDQFQVVSEVSITPVFANDKISAKLGATYRFDL